MDTSWGRNYQQSSWLGWAVGRSQSRLGWGRCFTGNSGKVLTWTLAERQGEAGVTV